VCFPFPLPPFPCYHRCRPARLRRGGTHSHAPAAALGRVGQALAPFLASFAKKVCNPAFSSARVPAPLSSSRCTPQPRACGCGRARHLAHRLQTRRRLRGCRACCGVCAYTCRLVSRPAMLSWCILSCGQQRCAAGSGAAQASHTVRPAGQAPTHQLRDLPLLPPQAADLPARSRPLAPAGRCLTRAGAGRQRVVRVQAIKPLREAVAANVSDPTLKAAIKVGHRPAGDAAVTRVLPARACWAAGTRWTRAGDPCACEGWGRLAPPPDLHQHPTPLRWDAGAAGVPWRGVRWRPGAEPGGGPTAQLGGAHSRGSGPAAASAQRSAADRGRRCQKSGSEMTQCPCNLCLTHGQGGTWGRRCLKVLLVVAQAAAATERRRARPGACPRLAAAAGAPTVGLHGPCNPAASRASLAAPARHAWVACAPAAPLRWGGGKRLHLLRCGVGVASAPPRSLQSACRRHVWEHRLVASGAVARGAGFLSRDHGGRSRRRAGAAAQIRAPGRGCQGHPAAQRGHLPVFVGKNSRAGHRRGLDPRVGLRRQRGVCDRRQGWHQAGLARGSSAR